MSQEAVTSVLLLLLLDSRQYFPHRESLLQQEQPAIYDLHLHRDSSAVMTLHLNLAAKSSVCVFFDAGKPV